MKFNLKNLKEIIKQTLDAEPDAIVNPSFTQWFEGFERELREKRRNARNNLLLETVVLINEVLGE